MKRYKRKENTETPKGGIKPAQHKPIILERRAKPEYFTEFFMRVFSSNWKRSGRYRNVAEAQQAYAGLMHTMFNSYFEYRLVTPVGIITLPVVKA